jgi:hypothetical protein
MSYKERREMKESYPTLVFRYIFVFKIYYYGIYYSY